MTNSLEIFSNDIFNLIQTINDNKETDIATILTQNFIELNDVLYKCTSIKEHVDFLFHSSLIDEILSQENFFSQNYFTYLDNRISEIPDTIQNIEIFYEDNKNDSYFNFKNIYNYFSSNDIPVAIKNNYNIDYDYSFKEDYSKGMYHLTCSVCQQDIAKGNRDLDHFLNKQYFPLLCLKKDNLVPMCRICNSSYKKTRLPKIPIIHPSKVKFPITNIPFKLVKLSRLVIKTENLSDAYKNYIELMDLERRLSHEDILSIIEELIKSIKDRTMDSVTPKMHLYEILPILKRKINDHIQNIDFNPDLVSQYHIKKQILESLANNILSQYNIAIMIYRSTSSLEK